MAENTEQIEAKLAAYVDGMLDDAERAQIEAHLKTNPQHRALLDDLITHRLLLRDLPKATAPAEVIERMEAHLERSGLLDDTPHEFAHPGRRESRWGRVAAIAAIVLLVLGLGGIVTYVTRTVPGTTVTTALNTGKETPATTQPETPGLFVDARNPTRDGAKPTPQAAASRKDQSPSNAGGGHAPQALPAGDEGTLAKGLDASLPGAATAAVSAAPADRWAREVETRRLDRLLGDSQRPRVLLLVDTNQSAVANRQVLAFLQAGQFVPQTPTATTQQAAEDQDAGMRNVSDAVVDATTRPVEASKELQGRPAMQLYVSQVKASEPSAGAATTRAMADETQRFAAIHDVARDDKASDERSAQVYVASGMTRGQVESLRQSLASNSADPRQQVYERPLVAVVPAESGTDGPSVVSPETSQTLEEAKTDRLEAPKPMGETPMPRRQDVGGDAPAAPTTATASVEALRAQSQHEAAATQPTTRSHAAMEAGDVAFQGTSSDVESTEAEMPLDVVIVVQRRVEAPIEPMPTTAPTTQGAVAPPRMILQRTEAGDPAPATQSLAPALHDHADAPSPSTAPASPDPASHADAP